MLNIALRRLLPLLCRTYWVIFAGAAASALLGAALFFAADPDAISREAHTTSRCEPDRADEVVCETSFGLAWYFAVVTLASVGFGDVTPTTPAGRLVTSLLILVPFPSLAVLTGSVASELMLLSAPRATTTPVPPAAQPFLMVARSPAPRRRRVMLLALVVLLGVAMVITLLGAAVVYGAAARDGTFCADAWQDYSSAELCEPSFALAWYFSVCTFGMVGYGEVVPLGAPSRLATSLYILACLPVYPLVAGLVAAGLIESRQAAKVGAEVALSATPLHAPPTAPDGMAA